MPYSNLQRKPYPLTVGPEVHVADVIRGVVSNLWAMAQISGVELSSEVSHGVGTVSGNTLELTHALKHLTANAIKFTPQGGQATISATRRRASVCISVSDTGVGIPVAQQHQVFSQFYRSTAARHQRANGAGTGLSIVGSVVSNHGGTVTMHSVVGKGTTVVIELPAVMAG